MQKLIKEIETKFKVEVQDNEDSIYIPSGSGLANTWADDPTESHYILGINKELFELVERAGYWCESDSDDGITIRKN